MTSAEHEGLRIGLKTLQAQVAAARRWGEMGEMGIAGGLRRAAVLLATDLVERAMPSDLEPFRSGLLMVAARAAYDADEDEKAIDWARAGLAGKPRRQEREGLEGVIAAARARRQE